MPARQLFDEILAHADQPDVASYLRAMIGNQYETGQLDFKSASYDGKPLQQNKVNEIWGEAISGFSTTGGGVIVWGIDARKLPGETVDQACGVNPVLGPAGFASRLRSNVVHATDPPVSGVEALPFTDPTLGPDQGFVVCYVPDSPHKPHRSNFGGKRWMMRTSDSFTDVPAAMLRSLFYPQVQARLSIVGIYSWHRINAGDDALISGECHVSIFNAGPKTARDVVVEFQSLDSVRFDPQLELSKAPGLPAIELPLPLHPGRRIHLFTIGVTSGRHGQRDVRPSAPFLSPILNQMFTIYAADREAEYLILRLNADELIEHGHVDVVAGPQPDAWVAARNSIPAKRNGRHD